MTLDAYDLLCAWSLSLGDADFVHQHVVDARMLQTATSETKPIGVAFALAALYLHLERGFTGREVQRAHIKMGRSGGPWPTYVLPATRGGMTHDDVLAAPEGPARIRVLRAWCASVWAPWSDQRAEVLTFLQAHEIVP